jgi:hypothetical protein
MNERYFIHVSVAIRVHNTSQTTHQMSRVALARTQSIERSMKRPFIWHKGVNPPPDHTFIEPLVGTAIHNVFNHRLAFGCVEQAVRCADEREHDDLITTLLHRQGF